MNVSDRESFEVENHDLFTLEKKDTKWIYTLKPEKYFSLHNITLLFRGQEDEILKYLLYGVLIVNGICLDILCQADTDDSRVREFPSFDESHSFPGIDCDLKIIIYFRMSHSYPEDKIRIIADVILLLFSFFHTDEFHKVIRNSGFIISTILIRVSFSVSGVINNVLIVSAILFGLIMLFIHNKYEKHLANEANENSEGEE
jgi:hypothetical protein